MSKNIHQVFVANPITSNTSTDLMYFGKSPYGIGDDAAMTYANFSAQFGSPYTASALTRTNDTNVTLTLGGSPSTSLLAATSLTLGWSGQLSVSRGGTGNSTFTAYSVICAGTTATGVFQNVSGVGSSGDVLTSNGAGMLPTWQAGGGGGGVTSTQVQTDAFNTGTDTGTVNAYAITLTPVPTLADGLKVKFLAANANTIAQPTLNVNSTGDIIVYLLNGGTLLPYDISPYIQGEYIYSSLFGGWILLNPYVSSTTYYVAQADLGAADNYFVVLPDSAILATSINYTDNLTIVFAPANSNTTASVMDAGFGPKAIVKQAQAALVANDIVQGINAILVYSFTNDNFQLINPQTSSGGGVSATDVQSNLYNTGPDSGVADAYDVAVPLGITSPYPGMMVSFTAANSNSTPTPTLALNGGLPMAINKFGGYLLAASDIVVSAPSFLITDSAAANWYLINPSTVGDIPRGIMWGTWNYCVDSGPSANVYETSNVIAEYGIPGTMINLNVLNTNTGASTFELNGSPTAAITYKGIPLIAGQMIAGEIAMMVYNGTTWQLINSQV